MAGIISSPAGSHVKVAPRPCFTFSGVMAPSEMTALAGDDTEGQVRAAGARDGHLLARRESPPGAHHPWPGGFPAAPPQPSRRRC